MIRDILDGIRRLFGLPHDSRMRLTLKDMARYMPKSRIENPHAALPHIERTERK
jgi:hypothetical protein